MSFLHVLLAIALTLGGVRARSEEAVIERWRVGVFVIDVTVTLLLGRPAVFVIFALVVRALPWTLMRLEMLGQVAWTLELFVAQRAFVNLRFGVLLPPGHGPEDLIFVGVDVVIHGTLRRHRGDILWREFLAGGHTYSLSILMTH